MKRSSCFLILFFIPLIAIAGPNGSLPNIGDMFANFSSSIGPLIRLVGGISFLLGLIISGSSALKLIKYSQSQGQVPLSSPFILFIVGICLITLPGTIDVASQTLSLGSYSPTDIFSQAPAGGGGIPGMDAAMKGIMLFIALVGNIAIVRGFMIIKSRADGNTQAGYGKAMVHIIGGVLAVNMHIVATILANSLGIVLPV